MARCPPGSEPQVARLDEPVVAWSEQHFELDDSWVGEGDWRAVGGTGDSDSGAAQTDATAVFDQTQQTTGMNGRRGHQERDR
jgi:hypothetical protein